MRDTEAQYIYRVDSFTVPQSARAEFLRRVRETHSLLRLQPGLVSEAVLEQPGESDVSNIVTIAVWEDAIAIEAAKAVVAESRKGSGFNPGEMFARLGIKAHMGAYLPVTD